MNRSIVSLATLAVFLVMGGIAHAGQLTIPNSFTSGTAASASQVNANFTSVQTAVNDNDTRITTNTSNISANTSGVSSNSSSISTNSSGISSNSSAITGKVSKSGDTMSGTLNVTGLAYTSPSTRTRYLAISPAAFRPLNAGYPFSNWSGNLYPNDTGSFYRFFAQVSLPHGAIITRVDVWTEDSSTTGYLGWWLQRSNSTGLATVMASTFGVDTDNPGSQTLTDTSILNATVDNYNYSYTLQAYFKSDVSATKLNGVRITYTVSAPD